MSSIKHPFLCVRARSTTLMSLRGDGVCSRRICFRRASERASRMASGNLRSQTAKTRITRTCIVCARARCAKISGDDMCDALRSDWRALWALCLPTQLRAYPISACVRGSKRAHTLECVCAPATLERRETTCLCARARARGASKGSNDWNL